MQADSLFLTGIQCIQYSDKEYWHGLCNWSVKTVNKRLVIKTYCQPEAYSVNIPDRYTVYTVFWKWIFTWPGYLICEYTDQFYYALRLSYHVIIFIVSEGSRPKTNLHYKWTCPLRRGGGDSCPLRNVIFFLGGKSLKECKFFFNGFPYFFVYMWKIHQYPQVMQTSS